MSRKLLLVTALVIVLLGMLGVALEIRKVEASGTIYIRADGRVDPPEAEESISSVDNVTYIITKNIQDSIIVERDNIVVDGAGYTLQGAGNGKGIELSGRSNVTIQNVNIEAFDHGIYLYESGGNSIHGNNITANSYYGIWLEDSSNNGIYGNSLTNNYSGITVDYSSNNSVSGNNITASVYGGIEISFSSNNGVDGNNIKDNYYGIIVDYSSNNTFYHNNFINNTEHVEFSIVESWENVWDNGYPSGGNYWDNYTGLDLFSGPYRNVTGSDGIGDESYVVYENNVDNYPFVALVNVFDAGVWNNISYRVHVVSNSTVSSFELDTTWGRVSFNVTGRNGVGFCRVTIPEVIVQDLWHRNYTVLVDGQSVEFRNWTDDVNTYIYFMYQHSEYKVTIVPEFPLTLVLPLFMMVTLLAVMLRRRKHYSRLVS